MNFNQKAPPSESERQSRNAYWISILVGLILAGSGGYALWAGDTEQLWSIVPIFIAALAAYWFTMTGRHLLGSMMLIGVIGLQSILAPLVQRGAGAPSAVGSLALIGIISLATLPRKFIGRVLMIGLFVAGASMLIDLFGGASRPAAGFTQIRWIFSLAMLATFGVLLAKEFFSLDIRTKIVLGILFTGGFALAVLVFFAIDRTQQITSSLSGRLETSVSQLAEEQLINTAFTQANLANQSFEDVMDEVVRLAQNWVALQSRKEILSQGGYWNAQSSLVQLASGQYGNSLVEPSSVFVPIKYQINDSLIADLNTSAYLDFYAPGILETHPSLLAVYAIDKRGVTRYYPNINLASILPPDFDATQRPYFKITSPLFNPQRLPRWTIPYVDATGGGLVVTVAAPIYRGDEFNGVVAADMQLATITKEISTIKVGQTGYAFMIDAAGRIISMPPAGFKMFNIHPEDINSEEFFKETILGAGTDELQALTRRMVAGGNGLLIVKVNGVDTYISYSPVTANGYSVGLVVPVSELQSAIVTAHNETQLQIQSASRVASLILMALLIMAVLVSLGLGQIIALPVQRLTHVASQIAAGDLTVQATTTTRDEIGTLAESFNSMTSRLRETLDGLEHRVEERTAELLSANERNERRAKQFESIAQIARTISSTRDLDTLLPQITTVINREFGFYHVGIFLLDTAKEYAVLSAANSEGGQIMLARGHRLKVGETSMVGYVTSTGKARVALDTEMDAVFFDNPNLPETRSEIALPLRVGEEVIGALDVQSIEQNAFSQEDINILSTLVEQVSIAIQNAQQFEQTRKALNESEVLSRQFIRTGWQQFTKSRNLVGIHHTGGKAIMLYEKNGKEKEEHYSDKIQIKLRSRGASLSLPIKLHGEVIGSVDVRAPSNRQWDQDELEIVTTIIERAALAMENARLLEESQRRASKEAKIGEVTARIGLSINMRNVLQIAVEELGHAIPGSDVIIQLESSKGKN